MSLHVENTILVLGEGCDNTIIQNGEWEYEMQSVLTMCIWMYLGR